MPGGSFLKPWKAPDAVNTGGGVMVLLPGSPHPLGATWDEAGVNFALYSEHATGVELCLFDESDNETRVALSKRTAFVWHGYMTGVRVGRRRNSRAVSKCENLVAQHLASLTLRATVKYAAQSVRPALE
jgi:pullulanase/glycogen debranching enzyme